MKSEELLTEAIRMHKQGMTKRAIAERLGCKVHRVWYALGPSSAGVREKRRISEARTAEILRMNEERKSPLATALAVGFSRASVCRVLRKHGRSWVRYMADERKARRASTRSQLPYTTDEQAAEIIALRRRGFKTGAIAARIGCKVHRVALVIRKAGLSREYRRGGGPSRKPDYPAWPFKVAAEASV